MVKAGPSVVNLWWRLLGCPFTVSVCFAACMKDANPFLFFLLVGCGKSARWKACFFLIWNPWAESGLLPSKNQNHLAEERKSFGWRWKIVWLRTENHLAQTFFVAFRKEGGLSTRRGPLFPGVMVSHGKHIHPHHLFVDRINDTVLRIDAARPVSGQFIF